MGQKPESQMPSQKKLKTALSSLIREREATNSGQHAGQHASQNPKPTMALKSPGARLGHLVAILVSGDDRLLIKASDILRRELEGLMVVAAPNSQLLRSDNSDIGVFLGDTSVESQAELCVQRTVQEFGRVDLLISITPEQTSADGFSYSVSDLDRGVTSSLEGEMRMGEFDHLLYSKIRSVYLLSRFVRRAKKSEAQAKESGAQAQVRPLDFVLARLKREENSGTSLSPRQVVLSAVRSWMETYSKGSTGWRWVEIEELAQMVSSLEELSPRLALQSHMKIDPSAERGISANSP